MATKPKAKKATQPVAQPAPEPVQNSTETLVPSASTPLVFIHGNKVVAVTQKQLDEFAQAEAKHNPHPVTYLNSHAKEAKAKAKALDEAQALKRSQAEARHFRDSQQAMRRQPKGIQALGRTLWKLWG